jgi:2-succinyl-6-hydroxy-2,4-cyclohexadiene-1-carboxylate synthase
MFDKLASLLDASLIAPNLPGHGGRDAANTGWNDAVDEVVATARLVEPDLVVGYSMGGRLTLAAALLEPQLFPKLLLISTSLGIADPAERAARHHNDWREAASIEATGIGEFIDRWTRNPLLHAANAGDDLTEIRRRGRAAGISESLRGMGQAEQPYLEPELPKLAMPIVWVAGGRDRKYSALAEKAAAACRRGSVLIVDGAVHNVVAERPDVIAAAVTELLAN